ncbi:MAG: tetratricopeptide repeat protein [Acidobacteriota bacterium]
MTSGARLIKLIASTLLLRPNSIRGLAAERAKLLAWALMLAALAVDNFSTTYYASGLFQRQFSVWSVVGTCLYLAMVFVPVLVLGEDGWSGDGGHFRLSRFDYEQHLSVLFPVWAICLIAYIPLRPLFHSLLGPREPFVIVALASIYTLGVIRELGFLSFWQALATVLTGLATLPLAFVFPALFSMIPFFFLIPIVFLGWQRIRDFFSERRRELSFGDHLRTLTINPRDSDAHYQIGLLHLGRRRFDQAAEAFKRAVEMDPEDPDYAYSLGVVLLEQGRPRDAFDAFEKVYYKKPDYGFGDIKREIGKTYFLLDMLDEAEKFLLEFLEEREPDAEGRYWLARVYAKRGDLEQARRELAILLDRQRTFNKFRVRETRRWRREGMRSKI